jgi:DNA-binding transcriptional regulator YiaG
MTEHGDPGTEDGLRDKAKRLSARIAETEKALTAMRRERDDLVREFKTATKLSIPKIAAAVGVSESTVKAVLR